jgi:transcriptional regulator with XRE-family HTH domain
MNLQSIGRAVAARRRESGLTLTELAARAGVGRSTLAALESGKLRELGLGRVARLCEAVGLVLDVRPMALEAPLMAHRHLTEVAGRELTKAAIDDVITRGDLAAWRGLVQAMRADRSGRIARRVRETSAALAEQDSRARVFEQLLPRLVRPATAPVAVDDDT